MSQLVPVYSTRSGFDLSVPNGVHLKYAYEDRYIYRIPVNISCSKQDYSVSLLLYDDRTHTMQRYAPSTSDNDQLHWALYVYAQESSVEELNAIFRFLLVVNIKQAAQQYQISENIPVLHFSNVMVHHLRASILPSQGLVTDLISRVGRYPEAIPPASAATAEVDYTPAITTDPDTVGVTTEPLQPDVLPETLPLDNTSSVTLTDQKTIEATGEVEGTVELIVPKASLPTENSDQISVVVKPLSDTSAPSIVYNPTRVDEQGAHFQISLASSGPVDRSSIVDTIYGVIMISRADEQVRWATGHLFPLNGVFSTRYLKLIYHARDQLVTKQSVQGSVPVGQYPICHPYTLCRIL